ncbi:hypothetical protein C8Q78DRAFT_1075035 [Trametes maxima]|nr:hypothetical protein C8Q78DRAFT_1075035 [Trametes maxima]
MDEVITKRIHVSGLTPAITAKDLNTRLGSFGTVKALDGLGDLDAVGQPRKFAYVTLETTKGKLTRCMNLLSGVTWKGAKLRLGEAKPDFRERIALEHAALKRTAEEAANQPPNKRRRLPRGVQGIHAPDMSLVNPDNASTRGGWRVTPTGRVIRPVRMRPDHPLPEPVDAVRPDKTKGKDAKGKKKKMRDPPSRARRRTIDPTKWGSTHLKGIFLENAAAYPVPSAKRVDLAVVESSMSEDERSEEDNESEDSESEQSSDEDDGGTDQDDRPSPIQPTKTSTKSTPAAIIPPSYTPAVSTAPGDIAEETNQALNLLQSLFGDKDEWGGAESVGSDVEQELRGGDGKPNEIAVDSDDSESTNDSEAAMQVDEPSAPPAEDVAPPQAQGAQKTKLKDLFAPREEEAGFSLLGHLDLDLELEDDTPFDLPAVVATVAPSEPLRPIQPVVAQVSRTAALDPSSPLFFPSEGAPTRNRALDPTNWRAWFYRTDSQEAIRQRWEESKGELTAGWKRRHREAVKSRRRRGGGAGEAD